MRNCDLRDPVVNSRDCQSCLVFEGLCDEFCVGVRGLLAAPLGTLKSKHIPGEMNGLE